MSKQLKFRSKIEKLAFDIISEIYSKTFFQIFLHYYIKFDEQTYEVDIAIPQLHLAFEIQGEQHRDKKHFFHQNKRQGFYDQQTRDVELKETLEANGWTLIELYPEDLDIDIVKKKIWGE